MLEYSNFLVYISHTITEHSLRHTLPHVICCDKFNDGYGARVGTEHAHHAYRGGLMVHTAEVVNNAVKQSESPSLNVNLDILKVAAIWHDYGKIWDYDEGETRWSAYGWPEAFVQVGLTPLLVQDYGTWTHHEDGNPTLKTTIAVMKALGIELPEGK